MQPTDFAKAAELANTMNWHMTPQDFAFNSKLEPDGCLVLKDGSDLVGVSTCICYGKVGWFGNLIVDESKRRQGAGTALISHALGVLNRKGAQSVGIYAYPHLLDFYRKLGFKLDADFVVLKAESISFSSSTENVGCLKAFNPGNLAEIVSVDRACFGDSRAKLLKLILGDSQNRGYLAFEGDAPSGFAAAKVFGDSAEVGPLVCEEDQPEIAGQLLNAVLRDLAGMEAYMYVPGTQTGLLKSAFALGFREDFRLIRMFWGPKPAKSCIYLAESLERG